MAEFKNDRGSKLDEIKVGHRKHGVAQRIDADTLFFLTQAKIKKKKAEVSKQSTAVKTLQREVSTLELELGEPFRTSIADHIS